MLQKRVRAAVFGAIMTAFVFGVFHSAHAQAEMPPPTEGGTATVRVVATASIQNAVLAPVAQERGKYSLSFDLANGEMAQGGIRYGINLVRETEDRQEVVDEKVYDGEVSVGAGERKRITAEYYAPSHLKGSFTPWLIAKTSGGATVGLAKLADIDLEGGGEYVEILPSTCYLGIKGDPEATRYGLLQGVDISASETLVATCDVVSGLSTESDLNVRVDGFERSSFGSPAEFRGSPVPETFSFKPGERKTISVELPKAVAPQAYSAVFMLALNGRVASNSVTFHFVLQGRSATIQNVRLDRNVYAKGQVAAVSLNWSLNADNFVDSRSEAEPESEAFAEIGIADGNGVRCSETKKFRLIGASGDARYDLPIENHCGNPQVSVSVMSADGSVLDQKTVKIESVASTTGASGRNGPAPYLLPVAVMIVLAAAGAYALRRRGGMKTGQKPGGPAGTAVALIAAGIAATALFGSPSPALAAGTTYEAGWNIPGVIMDWVTYYVAIDKDVYLPGEAMQLVSTSGVATACSNGSWDIVYYKMPGQTSFTYLIPPKFIAGSGTNFAYNGSATANAPTTPGNYEVTFLLYYNHHGYRINKEVTIPFTVSPDMPEPTNVAASCPAPGNSVTVTWTPASGYTNHYVRIYDETADAPAAYSPVVTGTSYTWNGAIPGRRYSYWVHSANASGSQWSNWSPGYRTASVTCPLPPKPLDLVGSCPVPGTSATLTWTAPAGYTTFAPRLCDQTINPGCNPFLPGFWRNDSLSATAWMVNGVTPGHSYSGWVHTAGSAESVSTSFSCLGQPVNASCGTAARAYQASAETYGSRTFCSAGTIAGADPAFPAQGGTATWTCNGVSGGTNATCSATRGAVAAAAACGTAAKTYQSSDTSFGPNSFCASGALEGSTPTFPAQGGTATWSCAVPGGGPVNCSASRLTPATSNASFRVMLSPPLVTAKVSGVSGTHTTSRPTEIRVQPLNGFNGPVDLYVASPVGVPLLRAATVHSPGYSTTLSFTIPGNAFIGSYPFFVTARDANGNSTTTNGVLDISSGTGGHI